MQIDPAGLTAFTNPFGSLRNLSLVLKKMLQYASDLLLKAKVLTWPMATQSSEDFSTRPSSTVLNYGEMPELYIQYWNNVE